MAIIMRSLNRKLLLIFASVAILYGSSRLYFHLTDDFYPAQIATEFPHRENWIAPFYSTEEISAINIILSQPFDYLAKGAQTYAFASADGKYVLKIVKQKHLRLPWWEKFLLELPGLNSYREKRLNKKKMMAQRILNSARVSYESLQEETALVYIHLNRTEELVSFLTISDKLGFEHVINPNEIEFLLQKRAILLIPYLNSMIEINQEEGVIKALDKVFKLVVKRAKKQIADRDRRFIENIGFAYDEPIFIDVGRFERDPQAADPYAFREDLVKRVEPLRIYFEKEHPSLMDKFDSTLRRHL